MTYSVINNTLLACDSCGGVVWIWARGTHDSWHEQVENAITDASILMRIQTNSLED